MARLRKPTVTATRNDLSAAAADDIIRIKAWLLGVSPMVWRRVLVPVNFTLRELHGVIGEHHKHGGRTGSKIGGRLVCAETMAHAPTTPTKRLVLRAVLNGELEQTFREWHPGFRSAGTESLKKAA